MYMHSNEAMDQDQPRIRRHALHQLYIIIAGFRSQNIDDISRTLQLKQKKFMSFDTFTNREI